MWSLGNTFYLYTFNRTIHVCSSYNINIKSTLATPTNSTIEVKFKGECHKLNIITI